MEAKIKEMIDVVINQKGKDVALTQVEMMLQESYILKEKLLADGRELNNVPAHIEMAFDLINYIKSLN